ncbi:MAG: hypothetical protein CMO04_06785 [Thalassospira sp.]|nr:hypothetical protein [Thalassospira sp.]|tara:strand:+ start:1047 stop:1283 length:237 start_codon:yes stop_codon:yes gene_type:complete
MVHGLMVFGPDWPGQGMFGSVQFGQVWFGLVGSDLGGFGLTRGAIALLGWSLVVRVACGLGIWVFWAWYLCRGHGRKG